MAEALVLLAPGFEEIETVAVIDVLRRSGITVTIAGLLPDMVEGAHGIKIIPDKAIEKVQMKDFDALVVPGGNPGYKNLRRDERVLEMIKDASDSGKLVAAICAAPAVLSDAGVLKNRKCTIYPGMESEVENGGGEFLEDSVVVDGNLITSRGPATALHFALKIAERLVGKEIAEAVRKKTLTEPIME
ncbi:MAG: DJ-1/PfpI family protein [Candidatus Bathyarchaeum sp.]|nr:MAG: DJ-1/PfpI family protein [Candidatus Bathyarchaeum sp.]